MIFYKPKRDREADAVDKGPDEGLHVRQMAFINKRQLWISTNLLWERKLAFELRSFEFLRFSSEIGRQSVSVQRSVGAYTYSLAWMR